MAGNGLKKLPFAQTLPEARKAGAIISLFGRNAVVQLWQVVKVDKRGKLLLLQRLQTVAAGCTQVYILLWLIRHT